MISVWFGFWLVIWGFCVVCFGRLNCKILLFIFLGNGSDSFTGVSV